MPVRKWASHLRYFGAETPTAFRIVCAAVSGAALSLSYTGFYFSIYSWLCVGILLVVLFDARPRVAFACGFTHAFFFVLTSVPWIATVLAVHGGLSRVGGWVILLLIAAAWGALTGGFFGWRGNLSARISRKSAFPGTCLATLRPPTSRCCSSQK